jgi:site-specific DNA-methyltransferase (adenine-specific)
VQKNCLYYGDNLTVLREHIKDESIDLIYLDPPFNSRQDYNVLFAEKDGTRSSSQIFAFESSSLRRWNRRPDYRSRRSRRTFLTSAATV